MIAARRCISCKLFANRRMLVAQGVVVRPRHNNPARPVPPKSPPAAARRRGSAPSPACRSPARPRRRHSRRAPHPARSRSPQARPAFLRRRAASLCPRAARERSARRFPRRRPAAAPCTARWPRATRHSTAPPPHRPSPSPFSEPQTMPDRAQKMTHSAP